ncbi:hypothetical protein N431DRAFT_322954, partial [Stipitochalara longipes BDJ]
NLGDELVTIYVGDKRKKFVVHKKLLCGSADYFKGAFTRGFEEARKGEMYMSDDSPEAFSLYVDWLYRSSIPIVNTEAHLRSLYELYLLADKLCLIELKDKTMDTIQDMAVKYDLKDELIKPILVTKVIQNTLTKMEGLRSFCVHQMVWKDGIDENNAGEDDYDNGKEEYPHLLRSDARKLFQICSNANNSSFLNNFLLRLCQQVQTGTDELEDSDPREREEHDRIDRCFFHCHKRSDNCRSSQKQTESSFIRE